MLSSRVVAGLGVSHRTQFFILAHSQNSSLSSEVFLAIFSTHGFQAFIMDGILVAQIGGLLAQQDGGAQVSTQSCVHSFAL